MNPLQCQSHSVYMKIPYYVWQRVQLSLIFKFVANLGLLVKKAKMRSKNLKKEKKHRKVAAYNFQRSQRTNGFYKKKQDSSRTVILRTRKKLTFSGFRKSIDWFKATSREIQQNITSIWNQQWSVWFKPH